MDSSHQSQRLLQLGISLFLLSLLVGLGISHFTVPRLALSAHLVGILQGLALLAVGLLWPRLNLTSLQRILAFWLIGYQAVAAFSSNVLAATWGAGNSIIPIAAGTARGSALQEAIITIGLRSGGAALIAGTLIILWGVRRAPERSRT